VTLAALFLTIAVGLGPETPAQTANLPTAKEILTHMDEHSRWQDLNLSAYEVLERYYAANPRFKKEASLEVKAFFQRPDFVRSEVIKSEGSELIREQVFDKILDARKETGTKTARRETDIVPANYDFALLGRESCGDRQCYRLSIVPKKKGKYSIIGQIWVDAEDWAIVRLHGSPAKRPSFWTRSTEIDRHYTRVDGMWLCDSMQSISEILIAGRSTLKINYSYTGIQTDGLPTGPRG